MYPIHLLCKENHRFSSNWNTIYRKTSKTIEILWTRFMSTFFNVLFSNYEALALLDSPNDRIWVKPQNILKCQNSNYNNNYVQWISPQKIKNRTENELACSTIGMQLTKQSLELPIQWVSNSGSVSIWWIWCPPPRRCKTELNGTF